MRAMTIMLVDNRTLNDYRYLEHGVFYAILAFLSSLYISDCFAPAIRV
ncbi:DUF475 domain-containing protein [Ahrensia marina]